MNLIIVESPTKARTIERFVGKNFKVESSYGHVRDLPSSTLGIDIENDFTPKYITPRKALKNVKALKEAAKKAEEIILATDEDREGEAIAWHLGEVLKINDPKRIIFHEITKNAITEALQHPRKLNNNLINAQQARRILDRLVGYTLSPFLWKKVMRGLSAGRVQSVALRLIIEREKERLQFKPQEYWTITATLETPKDKNTFDAHLYKIHDKTVEKFDLATETDAKKIIKNVQGKTWQVLDVVHKSVKRLPQAPFTTSALQQEASKRFNFSAKQTMYIAQQLYEGVELEKETTGLITYMRTDSTHVADEALKELHGFIKEQYGDQYTLEKKREFKTKTKRAQEAHEAIRPTSVSRTPDAIKNYLDKKQFKLYELVWQRFVASQMQPAMFDATTIDIAVDDMVFRSVGQTLRFDGYLKVWPFASQEMLLPELTKGEQVTLLSIMPNQHFTQPPPRYSEASLIKTLEQYGIGRPSTYAPIMSTLDERGYVTRGEKRQLTPTEIGFIVNDLLVEHFPNIVDVQFTAEMEENLDKIAEGKVDWTPVVKDFYEPFAVHLEKKLETVEKKDMTIPTDEVCKTCGKPMIIKHGRFGKFLACSGFPDCKTTKALPPTSLHIPCPECKEGEIVERYTRKRKLFFGCSRYPDCTYATWKRPQSSEEKGDAEHTT